MATPQHVKSTPPALDDIRRKDRNPKRTNDSQHSGGTRSRETMKVSAEEGKRIIDDERYPQI
ncbi:hypothetical protein NEUTE1DRAFT_118021, partial [Neurospora tetrasperma FGSC 2508]